ncbi:MAG TPA: hypothetical protein VIJ94_04345 [Caulobacteraceae bacterium]
MSQRGPELEETPARQGQTGTGLRWVLRISLALIVLVFAVLWLTFARHGAHEQAVTPSQVGTTVPNSVKQASVTAPPGSVSAQTTGRKEQSTGG